MSAKNPAFTAVKSLEKQIAKENFSRWNQALQTKEPKKVAAFYTTDATFLPTVSNEFKQGPTGTQEYFTHFLEKDPTGEIMQEKIQTLGADHYLHSGMYNFTIGPSDRRSVVEARFTFVWKKDDQGEWKIIHQHSSVKPRSETD